MSTMIKETSYLLDTNIISEIIKPDPDFTMIRHMSEHSSDMAISVLTWSELIFGVERLGDGPRKKHLMDFLYDDVLESFLQIEFTTKAAETLGVIRSKMEKLGIPLSFGDSQLAATAIANDMTLVTRNIRHFEPLSKEMGLKLENWFD